MQTPRAINKYPFVVKYHGTKWMKNFQQLESYCCCHVHDGLIASYNRNIIFMNLYFILAFVLIGHICFSQDDHSTNHGSQMRQDLLFTKTFDDSSFLGKEIKVQRLIIPAGVKDTIPHRHDAHLIGFILEGKAVSKMKDKEPWHLSQGQIFYEYPNELHEYIYNPDKKRQLVILLYYLYNKGAKLYSPEKYLK
jgi:quercetin dioxygenase-like cupin family protein